MSDLTVLSVLYDFHDHANHGDHYDNDDQGGHLDHDDRLEHDHHHICKEIGGCAEASWRLADLI